jgi:hypothetical protein
MATQPLTHHEILTLAEPFSRRGRQVDLAASDRLKRCLAFRPVLRTLASGAPLGVEGLTETLLLESPEPGRLRLTRVLTPESGPAARLEVLGADPAALLERIEAVPAQRHFRRIEGAMIALSLSIEPAGLLLSRGEALCEGVTLAMSTARVRGSPAEIELSAPAGEHMDLPQDLLAVLGFDFGLLRTTRGGWSASVRVPGRGLAASTAAEGRLDRAVAQLAQTLREEPARFHERQLGARWAVTLRRALPLLVCIALVGGALAFARVDLPQDSPLRMLMFNVPPILMVLVFCMREIPRIEIPPLPRPLSGACWRARSAPTPSASPRRIVGD